MLMLLKIFLTPLSPAQRQLHRSLSPRAIRGKLGALIERHDDVGAQANLRRHGAFRGEDVRRAVEVGTERDASFGDFAQLVEAENLEAAGIGENGARPRHEAVQSAEVADGFDSGPQVEMVRVAKKNLDVEFFEDILRDRFYGCGGANGHEDRRFDLAMGRDEAPRASYTRASLDFELHGHFSRKLFRSSNRL